jgi:hypothetical protein
MAKKKKAAAGAVHKKKAAMKAAAAGPVVTVVNMIPKSLSRETNQDSEPSLSVNPDAPLQIEGTAFTPDPSGGPLAPIFISTDGGDSWSLNAIVPSAVGNSSTHDISLAFGSGGNLYGGILVDPSTNFATLRTSDFTDPTEMDTLESRPDCDQPFSHAITNGGKDRVYIGNNDFAAAGKKTATIDLSVDGGNPSPTFKQVRIEARTTAGQNGPQVRPVAHPDGTAYAAFYGWRSQSGSFPGNTLVVVSDIVVVRDDNVPGSPFQNLKDPADGLSGRLVVKSISVPFRQSGTPASGQQRIGGTLSLAVDPRPNQSVRVFIAWGDKQPASDFVLHVRCTNTGGVAWSPNDLLTVANATNAALAINSDGIVGLLYQELVGTGASSRWKTHFRRSPDGTTWSDIVLADTPATFPVKTFDPYLGDYDHLVSIDRDFYGIFSANNSPNMANFPSGVKYQRNANFATHTLLSVDNTTPVAVSIDPFFFKVSG